MRNEKRIDIFCKKLATYWAQVPDWRFTQLMLNLFKAYQEERNHDCFYEEDDDFLKFVESYFDSL